jgi:hypothetical protein
LAKASPKLDDHLQMEYVNIMSARWGVVSLSESPIVDTMWGLYADAHKGLVVEFDQTNELFANPSCVRCEYSGTPVVYDTLPEGNHAAIEAIARHKRTGWASERESRLIVPLEVCRKTPDSTSTLYLLALEAAVMVSVTFGVRTPDTLKQEVLKAVARPDFQHVTKWQIEQGRGSTPHDLNRTPLP